MSGKIPLPSTFIYCTVYGSSSCKFCRKAKQLLEQQRIPSIYYDIDAWGQEVRRDIVNYLTSQTDIPSHYRTIPLIFIYGKFLGGCTELEELLWQLDQITYDDTF